MEHNLLRQLEDYLNKQELQSSQTPMEVKSMKKLVEVIATALVDNPEEVDVIEKETDKAIIVELRVADEDMGKVIGKNGRIAKCIRTLTKAAAVKENKKVVVDILD